MATLTSKKSLQRRIAREEGKPVDMSWKSGKVSVSRTD